MPDPTLSRPKNQMDLDSLDQWLQSWEDDVAAPVPETLPQKSIAITIPALRKLIDDAKRMRAALNGIGETALAYVPRDAELAAAIMMTVSEAVDGV